MMLNELEELMEELQWPPYDEENQSCVGKMHHMIWVDNVQHERGTQLHA
jgi:hypothetical protein